MRQALWVSNPRSSTGLRISRRDLKPAKMKVANDDTSFSTDGMTSARIQVISDLLIWTNVSRTIAVSVCAVLP
jgi:hypothetical protein